MSARGGHSKLGSVGIHFIADARMLTGLRIDDLHVRNIYPRFAVDDSTRLVSGRPLMTLDYTGAFNLHLAADRGDGQDPATLAFVAPGDQDDLIVLLNL